MMRAIELTLALTAGVVITLLTMGDVRSKAITTACGHLLVFTDGLNSQVYRDQELLGSYTTSNNPVFICTGGVLNIQELVTSITGEAQLREVAEFWN